MADYSSDNEEAELPGGDFLATADAKGQNNFFSNCKNLKIMGGLHIAPGATLSFISHQSGSDAAFVASQPVGQAAEKTETHQHVASAPYGSEEGTPRSILPTSHQVANDPEAICDTGHSSTSVKNTSQKVPASRTTQSTTLPTSSTYNHKRNDGSTQHGVSDPPPPPLPPKPFRAGTSHTGYTPAVRYSDPSHESYLRPSPPIREGTSQTGSSPRQSPPGAEGFYLPSPPVRPDMPSQESPSSDSFFPAEYERPLPPPPVRGGTRHNGVVQPGRASPRDHYPAPFTAPTTKIRFGAPYVGSLQWSASEQAFPPRGPPPFPGIPPAMNRSVTMPSSSIGYGGYDSQILAATGAPPYSGQYNNPTHYCTEASGYAGPTPQPPHSFTPQESYPSYWARPATPEEAPAPPFPIPQHSYTLDPSISRFP